MKIYEESALNEVNHIPPTIRNLTIGSRFFLDSE